MSKNGKFKLILTLTLCLLLAAFCSSAMAEETDGGLSYTEVPVYVDGLLSCRGYVIGDNTYVFADTMCGLLGYDCKVSNNDKVDTLTLNIKDITVTVGKDDKYLTANGRCLYLPDGYVEIGGHAAFPIEVVAKLFTLDAKYDAVKGVYDLDRANEALLDSGDEFYGQEDLYWMSRVITWESGNQVLEGQVSVGTVVMNRCKSDIYPNTVKDVIFDTTQFSVVGTGAIYMDPWPLSIIAAKLALEGYNFIGDAMYFMSTTLDEAESIDELGIKIIDEHLFYIDVIAPNVSAPLTLD